MKVFFKDRDPQAHELRDLTERRVRFALRHLCWLVPRAEVHVSDVNRADGGIDKRCQVELETGGAASVVVTSVARGWRTALDNALARAAKSVMRSWRRDSHWRRLRRRRSVAGSFLHAVSRPAQHHTSDLLECRADTSPTTFKRAVRHHAPTTLTGQYR